MPTEQFSISPRIIYALPFLSIIDQNAKVFESVIIANNIEPDTSILLKNLHFSEIYFKKDCYEFEPDESKILIEDWNVEVIVTTFVQLFPTLISNSNKNIRKFHRLANSIIILDEIQPIKYWLLLKNIFTAISELLNIFIVFVNATKHLIFERDETISLINKGSYYKDLKGVSLSTMLGNQLTINELAEIFNLKNGKSYLFVFNTIGSAKEFYNLNKNKVESCAFLSTHIIPKERLQRI